MRIGLIIGAFFFSLTVAAECYLNGEPYPEGAVVSGLTCQADGSWQ